MAVAENGRLHQVDGFIDAFGTIMAAVRGEVACEVVTAKVRKRKNGDHENFIISLRPSASLIFLNKTLDCLPNTYY